MDKEMFLLKLRQALTGNIPAQEVDGHIEYYRDYINSQVRMGKTESEVMASLGNPRLIARSILDVSENSTDRQNFGQQEENEEQQNYYQEEKTSKRLKLPGWLITLLVFLFFLVCLNLLFRLAFSLLPYILPICLVVFIVKFLKDWL